MKETENSDKRLSARIKNRVNSFKNAFNGIRVVIRFEKNFRIQLIIFLLVIAAGVIFKISGGSWIAVILVSGLVLTSECFNTAIEHLGDAITEKKNINIRDAKDAAAAGVLIAAIISVITGLIVFIPAILRYFGL